MNTRRAQSTARTRHHTIPHLLMMWVLQHVQAFFFSLGQFCRNPLASFLTASVIGISLALPAGFYVILENARHITSGWEGTVQITAFLRLDIDDDIARGLAERLSLRNDIADVRFVSRVEALEEYRRLSGFAEAIDALQENPLPSLLLIQPRSTGQPRQSADELLKVVNDLPEIENAQFDQQWVKRLNAIIEIVQRAVFVLAVFLAMAVLLIVGNTIRMLIYHRRPEIEIAKLFGATNGFIQRPFLYSGFWYGISGGAIAWLLVSVSLFLLQQPANKLALLYASNFDLIGLSWKGTLAVLLSGTLLGLIGSWVSVQRHLKAIEPV